MSKQGLRMVKTDDPEITGLQGYRLLWLAVIQQAFDDLCFSPKHRGGAPKDIVHVKNRVRRINDAARHWIFESTKTKEGSLNWICSALTIDRDYIQAKAREQLKEGRIKNVGNLNNKHRAYQSL